MIDNDYMEEVLEVSSFEAFPLDETFYVLQHKHDKSYYNFKRIKDLDGPLDYIELYDDLVEADKQAEQTNFVVAEVKGSFFPNLVKYGNTGYVGVRYLSQGELVLVNF